MQTQLVISLCTGLLFVLTVECTEPKCSKFDYEEKLLNKMIRMEVTVGNDLRELKTTQGDVKTELVTIRIERDELKEYISKLKADLEETNKKNLESFKETFAKYELQIKNPLSVQRVEFRALDLADITPTDGQVMAFSNVDFNHGQGYDTRTGYFTAPVAGTYLLIIQICMRPPNYMYFELTVDDVVQTAFQASAFNVNFCVTWLSVSNMEVGARAWLKSRHTVIKNVFRNGGSQRNYFSGVLINKCLI